MAEECAIFDPLPSTALVLSITSALAFAFYILGYLLRSCIGRPYRSGLVYGLDLSKIAIAQASGVALSALLSGGAYAPPNRAGTLDSLSWFFATSLIREVFCVVIALLLGGLLTAGLFSALGNRCGMTKFTGALHSFGRYAPDEADSEQLLGGRSSQPRLSWWAAQLLLWLACTAAARTLGAFALPALLALGGADGALDFLLARAVFGAAMPCATKQLVFAGALRIVADVALLSLIHI